jgi:signal recognition particle subunit SRP68
MDESVESAGAATSESVKYSLPIHAIVQTLQNENGLRHMDYRRYRHYLTRRLKKVRDTLHFKFGRGKLFVKKELTVTIVNSADHLMILLLSAERAWSYAMELKDASTTDGLHKLKHGSISRLSKAVKWAVQLRSICLEKGDPQTALEATAYADWLYGHLQLQKESWQEALTKLTSAKTIYNELSRVSALGEHEVFQTRIQELEPPIRFCCFNTGAATDSAVELDILASAELKSKFDEIRAKRVVVETKTDSIEFAISFAGRNIPVEDLDIRSAFSMVQSSKESLLAQSNGATDMKSRDKQFSVALGHINDALSLVSKLTTSLTASSNSSRQIQSSTKVNELKGTLQQLKHYFNYQRLLMLYLKNNEVCSILMNESLSTIGLELHSTSTAVSEADAVISSQKLQEIAHLFDQKLNIVREILSIPGKAIYKIISS